MSKQRISIIMNCRNGEKDLPAALESVKNQTCADWEIVFWDNASTDQSAVIAQNFGPGLRYFRASTPTSLGAARNLAIQQARGDYIAFLDCDDLWRPEKLQSQLEQFEQNPRLGLSCTDTEISDGKKTIGRIFKRSAPKRGMVFEELIQGQWISMSSAMLSRKALDALSSEGKWFDDALELCEEADVFYRIAHDWETDFVDAPLTVWHVHGRNATFREFDKFADETRRILEKHRRLYPDYDMRHKEAAAILTERANFQEAISLWHSGQGKQARRLLLPQLSKARKYRLFWLASFLPPVFFNFLAKLHFASGSSN